MSRTITLEDRAEVLSRLMAKMAHSEYERKTRVEVLKC